MCQRSFNGFEGVSRHFKALQADSGHLKEFQGGLVLAFGGFRVLSRTKD